MSEKERKIPYVIPYMWHLKYDTNELVYEADLQTENNRFVVARAEGLGDGLTRGLGLANANYYT